MWSMQPQKGGVCTSPCACALWYVEWCAGRVSAEDGDQPLPCPTLWFVPVDRELESGSFERGLEKTWQEKAAL